MVSGLEKICRAVYIEMLVDESTVYRQRVDESTVYRQGEERIIHGSDRN